MPIGENGQVQATVEQVPGTKRSFYVTVDTLRGGLNTRTFPHLLPAEDLAVADNVVFNQDGLVAKRPGNVAYGSGTGLIGSGVASLSGARFYFGSPQTGQLIVQSNGHIYKGNDTTGVFTSIETGWSLTNPMWYAQTFDPSLGTPATGLFMTDGARVPRVYNGAAVAAVATGAGKLPLGRAGGNITPAYCVCWGFHMVYAGEPTEPQGLYISDALQPELFSGFNYQDSSGVQYQPYFPGGRDSPYGPITGLAVLGPYLIIFFSSAVYAAINTGSYGAIQFQFFQVSGTTGNSSPNSITVFDKYACFYGGDAFYATDGQSVVKLPDNIPTISGVAQASMPYPPQIKNRSTVISTKRGSQYWASYNSTNNAGTNQDAIAVFDTAANGGWNYGDKDTGAWARWQTGMPLSWGIQCSGPGDTFQMYWGFSSSDQVAIHDQGVYADLGLPISLEIRTKSFFLQKAVSPKMVKRLWMLLNFYQTGAAFNSFPQPYVQFDSAQFNTSALNLAVTSSGVFYGTAPYGSITYSSGNVALLFAPESEPQIGGSPGIDKGYSIAFGVLESSVNPFGLIGMVAEVAIDEPTNALS